MEKRTDGTVCAKALGTGAARRQVPWGGAGMGRGVETVREGSPEDPWGPSGVRQSSITEWQGPPGLDMGVKEKKGAFSIQVSGLRRDGGGGGLVAKLCPNLCGPIDRSSLGSSVHGISHVRILEWVAIYFSRESSQPRD